LIPVVAKVDKGEPVGLGPREESGKITLPWRPSAAKTYGKGTVGGCVHEPSETEFPVTTIPKPGHRGGTRCP
jgi:hypothetical protein